MWCFALTGWPPEPLTNPGLSAADWLESSAIPLNQRDSISCIILDAVEGFALGAGFLPASVARMVLWVSEDVVSIGIKIPSLADDLSVSGMISLSIEKKELMRLAVLGARAFEDAALTWGANISSWRDRKLTAGEDFGWSGTCSGRVAVSFCGVFVP